MAQHHQAAGRNVKRDFPAFTIRLPKPLYEAVTKAADDNRRSRAAEIELALEKIYCPTS